MPAVKPMDQMPCNMGNPLASTSMHVMPSNVMYRVNADNPLNLMSHCSTDPPTVNPTLQFICSYLTLVKECPIRSRFSPGVFFQFFRTCAAADAPWHKFAGAVLSSSGGSGADCGTALMDLWNCFCF